MVHCPFTSVKETSLFTSIIAPINGSEEVSSLTVTNNDFCWALRNEP
jgi:hypothetical protein